MPSNDQLYESAMSAVIALFGDTSISVTETRHNLENLVVEIQIMLESLEET